MIHSEDQTRICKQVNGGNERAGFPSKYLLSPALLLPPAICIMRIALKG